MSHKQNKREKEQKRKWGEKTQQMSKPTTNPNNKKGYFPNNLTQVYFEGTKGTNEPKIKNQDKPKWWSTKRTSHALPRTHAWRFRQRMNPTHNVFRQKATIDEGLLLLRWVLLTQNHFIPMTQTQTLTLWEHSRKKKPKTHGGSDTMDSLLESTHLLFIHNKFTYI